MDREKVPFEALSYEVFDKFSEYLIKAARHGCSDDPTSPYLSAGTASNYFSGVKTYYCIHHPKYSTFNHISPAFISERWATLRGGLSKSSLLKASDEGVPLSNPRPAITDDDFSIMALLCLWSGSFDFFLFLLFQCLLFQVGGRGTETATRDFRHISTRDYSADGRVSKILTIFIQRGKNLRFQNCTIFPQADITKWWKDFTFLLAIVVILSCHAQKSPSGSTHLFPKFHTAATKDQQNQAGAKRKRSGHVSSLWTEIYKKLYALYENKKEDFEGVSLNEKLGSHSTKKFTAQWLADHGNNPISTIFRVGWDLRSLHTLFDYIVGSQALDDEAAKVLSGWFKVSHGSKNSGGLPPSINDALEGYPEQSMEKEKKMILAFAGCLFQGCQLESDVQGLLIGALFKHWNSMLSDYKENDNLDQHLIVHTVNMALFHSKVEKKKFEEWCKNTEVYFRVKNIQGLSIRTLRELPPGVMIDARSFTGSLEKMEESMDYTVKEVTTLRHDFNGVCKRLENMQDMLTGISNHLMPKLDIPTEATVHTNIEHEETNMSSVAIQISTNQPKEISSTATKPQMRFSHWFDNCRSTKKCIEMFVHWHQYDLPRGHQHDNDHYALQLQQIPEKDEDGVKRINKERKRYNDRFSSFNISKEEMNHMLQKYDPFPKLQQDQKQWTEDITKRLQVIFLKKTGKVTDAPYSDLEISRRERKAAIAAGVLVASTVDVDN